MAEPRPTSRSEEPQRPDPPAVHPDDESKSVLTLCLTPEEQLAFWNALNETPKLTAAQRRLGAVMRGES